MEKFKAQLFLNKEVQHFFRTDKKRIYATYIGTEEYKRANIHNRLKIATTFHLDVSTNGFTNWTLQS